MPESTTLLPCPIYNLPGSPRERGRAYGESARNLIAPLLEEHFAFLEFSASYVLETPLRRAQILDVSDRYLPDCERFAPRLMEEIRGIAEGSHLPFREIFSLNTFIDLADMVREETAKNYLDSIPALHAARSANERAGCTSFGAMPPATRDGKVYLGQTFDTKAVFEPYVCALRISGDDEPAALVATFAGMVGCAGINSDGVGVVINHLHTYDARPGVPFTFAVRAMLREQSADAAVSTLQRSEPASGIHYLIGDETTLRGVETSPTKFDTLAPQDGWLAHANHCAAPALREVEVEPGSYSLWRGSRAAQLLSYSAGQIDAGTLETIARDHLGTDDSVCSHVEADAPRLRQYKTDFAVILDTRTRTMELFVGSPCEGRNVQLEMSS